MYSCKSITAAEDTVRLDFQRQGLVGRVADFTLMPVMKLLTGWSEAPQRTHFWNNQKFGVDVADELRTGRTLFCPGLPGQVSRKHIFDVRFHLGQFGGWRHYVVLAPINEDITSWYPGWLFASSGGISMVPVRGPVRLLIGLDNVHFFGIAESGEQIALREVGHGTLGDQGPYRSVPLR